MGAERVDVLAVMDAADDFIARVNGDDRGGSLAEARAAVAELIAADQEYDAAEVAWDALDTRDGLGDYQDPRDYDGPEYVRLYTAISRRARALARIGGAA